MTISANTSPRRKVNTTRKVIVEYGTPTLTVVHFNPPAPEPVKPKSKCRLIWSVDGVGAKAVEL